MCFWFVFSQEEEGRQEKRKGDGGSSGSFMWQENLPAAGDGDSE